MIFLLLRIGVHVDEVIVVSGGRSTNNPYYVKPTPKKVVNVKDSTNIKQLQYDKRTGEMVVEFARGDKYSYTNVSEKYVKGVTKAKSAGSYFANKVAGKHYYNKVK